jgi:hypothetical protein
MVKSLITIERGVMKTKIISLVVFLFLISTISFAQKYSLEIVGVTIKLGMTKDFLLNQLPLDCSLQPREVQHKMFPKNDSLLNQIKAQAVFSITKNNVDYGMIAFYNNKIHWITKYLFNHSEKDIFEIISTFYEALKNEIGTNKLVETNSILSERTDQNVKIRNISVVKNNWSINLTITKGGGNVDVVIDETIFDAIEN